MAMTAAQKQDAYKFFIVSFGAITGVEYMNQINDAYNAGLTTKEIVNIYSTKPQFEAIYPRFFSNEQFADKLIENVVGASATDAAKAQAKTDVVAALNAGWSKGDVVFQIFTNLSNKPADDADWAKTAAMLNNKVKVAEYYTETLLVNSLDLGALGSPLQSVTDDAASVEAAKGNGSLNNGKTFTLTTGVDNLSGTSGNDTFIGGTAQIQAADVIDGGAGTDTAKLYLDTAGAGLNASNVEIFQIQASGGARAFNATNVTGAEQIWSAGSTSALTIDGLKNNVTLGLDKTQSALNANFVTGTIGAAETLKLATDTSGTAGGRVAVTVNDGGAASKFTTLDVNAVAGKSFISINDSGTAANDTLDFTTLTTSGAGTVNLTAGGSTNAAFNNLTTVELNSAGGSTVNLGANAKDVKVTGGAGNDTVIFAANQFNTKDQIDLGAGKNTLTLGDANLNAGATDDLTKAINAAKNVQVLATTAVGTGGIQINADLYTTINEFSVLGVTGTAAGDSITGRDATAGTAGTKSTAGVTFSGVASDGTDTLVITEQRVTGGAGATDGSAGGSGANAASAAVLISAKLDSGADAVNLTIGDTTGAVILTGGAGADASGTGGSVDAANANALDARQFETVNLTVGNDVTFNAGTAGGVADVADVLLGANAKLTITGKGDVDLGTVAADATQVQFQNLTIDATTLDGKLTVVTGDGNDVIKAGSKGSVITAGKGLDQITLGAGQDVVNVNPGDSGATVTTTSISGIDVITGFKAGLGGDQLNELAGGNTRAYDALTANQQTTVTNAADLKAATDAALAVTNNNEWTAFTFGGKTYAAYNDTTTAGYVAGEDIIVELVGVTVADLVSANFA